MNNIPSFSQYIPSFTKGSFLPSLTAQQKKIVAFASLIFAALSVCYLAYRYCFKAQPLKKIDEEERVAPICSGALRSDQPTVISDEWGKIKLSINGKEAVFKDVVILPTTSTGKQTAIKWEWKWEKNELGQPSGMSHKPGIRMIDIEHYILSRADTPKPEVIILSQGRGDRTDKNDFTTRDHEGPGVLQIEAGVKEHLEKEGIEVIIAKTAAAVDKYKALTLETTKKVAAMIHTTC